MTSKQEAILVLAIWGVLWVAVAVGSAVAVASRAKGM